MLVKWPLWLGITGNFIPSVHSSVHPSTQPLTHSTRYLLLSTVPPDGDPGTNQTSPSPQQQYYTDRPCQGAVLPLTCLFWDRHRIEYHTVSLDPMWEHLGAAVSRSPAG
jgi:hypothetical protein